MLHANDSLEAPDKHTGVLYTTHELIQGIKSTVHSCPVSLLGHMSHNSASIKPTIGLLENKTAIKSTGYGDIYPMKITDTFDTLKFQLPQNSWF